MSGTKNVAIRGTDETTFANHTREDSAFIPSQDLIENEGGRTTLLGKLVIFLFFPTIVGFLALYVGYLETSQEGSTRQLSFDQDFALPFALALALCLVVGFQTGGFATNKPRPLISWPKVRRRKKVVHRHVVKGSGETKEKEDGPADETKKIR